MSSEGAKKSETTRPFRCIFGRPQGPQMRRKRRGFDERRSHYAHLLLDARHCRVCSASFRRAGCRSPRPGIEACSLTLGSSKAPTSMPRWLLRCWRSKRVVRKVRQLRRTIGTLPSKPAEKSAGVTGRRSARGGAPKRASKSPVHPLWTKLGKQRMVTAIWQFSDGAVDIRAILPGRRDEAHHCLQTGWAKLDVYCQQRVCPRAETRIDLIINSPIDDTPVTIFSWKQVSSNLRRDVACNWL